jgi:hypothetical protein
MAEDGFSKGDKVEWESHGQKVKGTVEEKITEDTEAARVSKEKQALRPDQG